MSIRKSACLLFSLCFASTSNASENNQLLWKTVNAWTIQVTDTQRPLCSARTFWDDGTKMKLGYFETSSMPQMQIENPKWTNGSGPFGLVVQFGSELPWRQPNSDTNEALSLRVAGNDLSFFESIMGGLNVSVRYAKDPIQTLPLNGALEAYHELRRCQSLVTGTASK